MNFSYYKKAHPEVLKYICDWENFPDILSLKDDIQLICPDCGYRKTVKVSYLTTLLRYQKKYSCPNCSDGISKPNKLIRYILNYFRPNQYSFEYSINRDKQYRYDAYFVKDGVSYLCEMDGKQHKDTSRSFGTQKNWVEIDKIKDEIAKENNYKLIRVWCPDSNYDTLRQAILETELRDIFVFSGFDWQRAYQSICTSLQVSVWKYYNDNSTLSTLEIAEAFKLSEPTIRRYLNNGTKAGVCNYSGEEVLKNNLKLASKANMRTVEVYDLDGKLFKKFDSGRQCSIYFREKLGCKQKQDSLAAMIIEKRKKGESFLGYTFKIGTNPKYDKND